VYVWRIGQPKPTSTLTLPALGWGLMNGVFSQDGKRLVTDGRGGTLVIWDLQSGRAVGEAPKVTDYAGLDWMPDGRSLLAGTTRGLAVIDAGTAEVVRTIQLDDPVIGGSTGMLRVSPVGGVAAVSTRVGIALIDLQHGKVRSLLSGHTQQVVAVAFSADGQRLASTGWDRTVRIWDLETGAQERSLLGHAEMVNSVGFALSDSRVITSGSGGAIRYWNPHHPLTQVPLQAGSVVFGIAVLSGPPGTGGCVAASTLGRLQCWDLTDGYTDGSPRLPALQPAPLTLGAISPDRALIAAFGPDSSVLTCQSEGQTLWTATGMDGFRSSLIFSPDSSTLATVGKEGLLRLWDARTGAPLGSFERRCREASPACFSPDSSQVALAAGNEIFILEGGSARLLARLRDPERQPKEYSCVTFSPDGGLVATGDSDGIATIWDAATYRPLRRLGGMKPMVWSLAFNPSGTRLATGSQDRMARIWDPRSGEELLVLRGHTGTVISLAWSPGGDTLATGSYDKTVRLWQAGGTAGPARVPDHHAAAR
jgi:WD40 repeat protein